MDRVLRSLRVVRVPLLVGTDAVAWLAALALVTSTAHRGSDLPFPADGLLSVWVLVVCLHALTGFLAGDLVRRAPTGGLTDALLVGVVALTAGFWAGIINALPFTQWLPMMVPLAATPAALGLQTAARGGWRLVCEHAVARRVRVHGARRTLVVGAGGAAHQLVRSMLSDPQGRYTPVGVVVHGPAPRRRTVCRRPVLGTSDDLGRVLAATGCDLAVLATPRLDARASGAVVRSARDAGVEVKRLIDSVDFTRHAAGVGDLLDVLTRRPTPPGGGIATLQRPGEGAVG